MRRFFNSWQWLLILFSAAAFLEAAFWGQMGAFTPLFLPELGVAPGEVALWVGAIASLASLVGLPLLPLWGALADRYSRQPIIVRSFVAHGLAAVLTVLAGNVWVFLLARAVGSLSLGNSGLMMTTLAERAPAGRQGLAFGVMNSASPVGVFVGPLVGGPIVDAYGFRALAAANAVLMVLVVLAMSLGYRDHFRSGRHGPLLRMAWDSVGLIGRSPRLRALFAALFVLFAGWLLALTYVPVAVETLYQGAEAGTVVGAVMGAGGLVAMLFGPIIGALGDRFGHWRTVMAGALLAVGLWSLPAVAPGLLGFGAAWALVNGLMSGVFAVSFSVLSASAASDVRGRVMSFAYLPVNLGGVVGPGLGSLVTRAGVMAVFPAAAVLTLAGVGMMALARRQGVEVGGDVRREG